MSNPGFHEIHIWCGNPVKLARLQRRAPDLHLKADCDPADTPAGSTCYEFPAGREAELEKACRMGRPPIRYEWGGGPSFDFVGCFRLGDFLYGIDAIADALRIWNISNPVSPSPVATLALGGNPTAIWLANSICYVACSDGPLVAVNIDDPANPFIEPNGVAATGENFAHLRIEGDIGVLSGENASKVALYDIVARPPKEIDSTTGIVGSQAGIQGNRLYFGATSGNPRALLYNFFIGGSFCPLMHTFDLYAEAKVTTEEVRARNGFFTGEIVADMISAVGGASDTEGGSVSAAIWLITGPQGRKIGSFDGDPNGIVTAPQGSLLLGDSQIWRNTDGTNVGWV